MAYDAERRGPNLVLPDGVARVEVPCRILDRIDEAAVVATEDVLTPDQEVIVADPTSRELDKVNGYLDDLDRCILHVER